MGSAGKLIVFAVFILSRLVVVSSEQRESDLRWVNVPYAVEAQQAARQGVSLYQLHAGNRRLANPSAAPSELAIEYPPLSILWMRAPTLFLDPVPQSGAPPESWLKSARRANQVAMSLVDLCGFALLALAGTTAAQLAVYTLGGLLLFPLLYDRLDLLLGVLILSALLLLIRKQPYWMPLAILAIAINFKVTPLVLVPLFVLGTLPATALTLPAGTLVGQASRPVRLWIWIAQRLACLAAFGAAVFLPFLVRDGFATLGFLGYHANRGLEIASVWNTLPIALGALVRWPVSASFRFGAVELNSAMSGLFRTLSSISTALVIPAISFVLWKLFTGRALKPVNSGSLTLAQANPSLFIRCTVLCLLTAIIPAPVLSPQYLLWLVPLFALWKGRLQWFAWGVFLTICALSTLHFPFLTARVLGVLSVDNGLPLWERLLWPAPLILRNLLLIAFTAWLWVDTFRRPA